MAARNNELYPSLALIVLGDSPPLAPEDLPEPAGEPAEPAPNPVPDRLVCRDTSSFLKRKKVKALFATWGVPVRADFYKVLEAYAGVEGPPTKEAKEKLLKFLNKFESEEEREKIQEEIQEAFESPHP
eukprot:m.124478 g.124478  ORF g.124478 m.124478 type:complete len:128 (-) comp14472_c0_seq4:2702-3085(-)